MSFLQEIITNKKQEVARQQEAVPVASLENIISENNVRKISFREALINSSTGIIAEFKRKSPSKGWINKDAVVSEVVRGYASAGAAAISVLTDERYFGGSFEDFRIARESVDIPLLRKDFIIDSYQVYQSKAMRANVILLIASALTRQQTSEYACLAHELGLEVLLEIHNEEELEYIVPEIDVVGINNRNLSTFVTDTQCSLVLGEKIPSKCVKISESGLSESETVAQLRRSGFKGFLMGENFMKTPDPGEALRKFIC